MTLQLAWVAARDADAIDDGHRWPPSPLPEEDLREHARLRALAQRLFYRSAEKGFCENGTDFAFGEGGDGGQDQGG